MEDAYQTWHELQSALIQAGIEVRNYSDLTTRERSAVESYFRQVVYPVLTPLAFDPGRPFPHISNLSLNLAVAVRDLKGVERFARVKIPDTLPQLVAVPQSEGAPAGKHTFIWLEQLIIENLHALFPGLEIIEAHPFRVTRDAEVAIQELESDDLLETVEEAIWQRRFRAVVRLQVAQDIPDHILQILVENLESDRRDVYYTDGALDLSRVKQILSIERPDLKGSAVPRDYSTGAEPQGGRRRVRGAASRRRAAASPLRILSADRRVFAARCVRSLTCSRSRSRCIEWGETRLWSRRC
jgi:polyphosphate kinase